MKRYTIAITGLPNAGKTTFTQRLITGRFTTNQPTLGVDVELTDYNGHLLQIWDMGGHYAFRKHIWKSYILQSKALIFIFDASDLSNLKEAKDCFWDTISWVSGKQTSILFLANKMDLVKEKDETIEKVVSEFELNKLAAEKPESSFRFFFVSVKTGEYISDAMQWLIKSVTYTYLTHSYSIDTFDLFLKVGDNVVHIHDNSSFRSTALKMISLYKERWTKLIQEERSETFEELNYSNFKVIFIIYKKIALLVTTKVTTINKTYLRNVITQIEQDINNIMNDDIDIGSIFGIVKKIIFNNFHLELANILSCDVISIDDIKD